ncbi:MAG TPA: SDR family NAD(P)-dependent oxidoreductase, partial [Chitinophagales bacterium]|nr:SDR family NAD(P)-dependent oxidoreductase [Chitinophagales bacterium]
PAMKKQMSGHIINVSSIASVAVAPYMSAYNATKAAVKALSETLYAELKQFNVGVSVMMPFFFRTNITQYARGDRGSGELSYYMVHGSKVSAHEVAQKTLKEVGKGKFYILLPSPAKSLFRMQRLSPMGLLKMNAKFAQNPDLWLKRAKAEYEKRKKEGVI